MRAKTAQPILTVCILAKNEAAVIARAIRSVQTLAFEILVGDTGSNDATVALATAAGARVVAVLWEDDFAAARNRLQAHAVGDWILWLDADEWLDDAGV